MPAWIRLADIDECPEGETRELVVAGRIVALIRLDGQFFALDGLCPHQQGALGRGTVDGGCVVCPRHGLRIDVRTGEHGLTQSPPQPTYPLKVEQGAVWIELGP